MPSKRQQRRKQQHDLYKTTSQSQSTAMDVDSSEAESVAGSSTSGRPKGGSKQAAHLKKRWEKNAEDQETEVSDDVQGESVVCVQCQKGINKETQVMLNCGHFMHNSEYLRWLKNRGQPKCPGCEKAHFDFCVGCREPFANAAITKLHCGHFIHTNEFLKGGPISKCPLCEAEQLDETSTAQAEPESTQPVIETADVIDSDEERSITHARLDCGHRMPIAEFLTWLGGGSFRRCPVCQKSPFDRCYECKNILGYGTYLVNCGNGCQLKIHPDELEEAMFELNAHCPKCNRIHKNFCKLCQKIFQVSIPPVEKTKLFCCGANFHSEHLNEWFAEKGRICPVCYTQVNARNRPEVRGGGYGNPSLLGNIAEDVVSSENFGTNLPVGPKQLRGYCGTCAQGITKLEPFFISDCFECKISLHHLECFDKHSRNSCPKCKRSLWTLSINFARYEKPVDTKNCDHPIHSNHNYFGKYKLEKCALCDNPALDCRCVFQCPKCHFWTNGHCAHKWHFYKLQPVIGGGKCPNKYCPKKEKPFSKPYVKKRRNEQFDQFISQSKSTDPVDAFDVQAPPLEEYELEVESGSDPLKEKYPGEYDDIADAKTEEIGEKLARLDLLERAREESQICAKCGAPDPDNIICCECWVHEKCKQSLEKCTKCGQKNYFFYDAEHTQTVIELGGSMSNGPITKYCRVCANGTGVLYCAHERDQRCYFHKKCYNDLKAKQLFCLCGLRI